VSFKSLLKRLQKRHYPSVRAFAHALGIEDASRLSRGKPFDVYWCLRLAQVTGENPSLILRAANKGAIATLIEALYGSSRTLLTPDQQALLEALDAIRDPVIRQALIALARRAAGLDGGTSQGGTGTEGGGPVIPPSNKEPDYKMNPLFGRRTRVR
jgi:hypothetical protein